MVSTEVYPKTMGEVIQKNCLTNETETHTDHFGPTTCWLANHYQGVLLIEMEQDTDIGPEQLKSLERKFCAFLEDVSLKRRHEKPREYLMRAYGPHFATLQWGENAFYEATIAAQRLCPNISTRQIAEGLRNLMVKMFEDQAVRENGTTHSELESIAEIIDTSNVTQHITQVILSLRRLARPQVVFVPIEGLEVKAKSLPRS